MNTQTKKSTVEVQVPVQIADMKAPTKKSAAKAQVHVQIADMKEPMAQGLKTQQSMARLYLHNGWRYAHFDARNETAAPDLP